MAEIESLINSIPLAVVNEDEVTPAELFYHLQLLCKNDEFTFIDLWNKRKQFLDHFWEHWRADYLYSLSMRSFI